MIQIVFAILAGILTVGAPCILPLLPILLGASVGQKSRTRPLFIALGFIVMFSLTGLTLSFVVTKLMIAPDILRNIAVIALGVFGFFMIFPKLFEFVTQYLSSFTTKAQNLSQRAGSGNFGGFVLGIILGLIWTPCAGPILGSILTLVAAQTNLGQASVLLVAYAIGAGIPMLAIGYGGQLVTTRVRLIYQYTGTIQKVFGVLIFGLAIAMYFQYDLKLQTKILELYNFSSLEEQLFKPDMKEAETPKNNQMIDLDLPKYGKAPEFAGIDNWLNSEPLTMQQLKGKVVLIDFWTYSCINCIRTLPYVTKWYDTYNKDGLVVVGIHTPEFAFEKVTENVKTAIERYNIHYPVAQDNNFSTWNTYNNHYWPAHYLLDKEGNLRYYHFGEGKYDETENAIKYLLGLPGPVEEVEPKLGQIKTPEIYFGTDRLEYFSKSQEPSNSPQNYSLPEKLENNHFALEGKWQFFGERVKLVEGSGKIKMKFVAGKIHIVAMANNETTVNITVDGKQLGSVKIHFSDLYTLFDSRDYNEHEIIIEIPQGGFEAFTFTFG